MDWFLYTRDPRHERVKTAVLKSFTKFTTKQSLFQWSYKHTPYMILFKNRPWHKHFTVNFGKYFRTTFFKKTTWRLLQILLLQFLHFVHISNINFIFDWRCLFTCIVRFVSSVTRLCLLYFTVICWYNCRIHIGNLLSSSLFLIVKVKVLSLLKTVS